jgi:hypothetical protein
MKLRFWNRSNSRYRKYKELAHMACLTNQISQPSLDISPIWIPLISNKVLISSVQVLLHNMVSQILHLIVCTGVHGLGLLARFVA